MPAEQLGQTLMILLTVAWLLPLVGVLVGIFVGPRRSRRSPGQRWSKIPAHVSTACIAIGFFCSAAALIVWGSQTDWIAITSQTGEHHKSETTVAAADDPESPAAAVHEPGLVVEQPTSFSGSFYTLGRFGPLDIRLDWYIDSLTLVMFVMVTLIATCIHIFAIGYMDEELRTNHEDHEVTLASGEPLRRPGRFHRFFAYLSLFCFSMLGLVLAGNLFQVFVFWELVGICSYLLIGFYVERQSAGTAANKAFIVNRVGDFGFLIGLMIVVTSLGTFAFADHEVDGQQRPGLFTLLRGTDGELKIDSPTAPETIRLHNANGVVPADGPQPTMPYLLLVAAGLGIFAGCVGKSAQFPLHTWLPDAMAGPTPVSALVHSATMVAAGVYLVGRVFPLFTPEVLLIIAYVGCVTLFVGATIAVVATDIKQVLAYSTISQLGYMMLALGVGGWGAGMFHLFTHAFFKSLMFLAAGSVIHACHHVQDMRRMGGLFGKMPVTAITMLVGVIAICGLSIPGTAIAFSGYHSKDAIIATALAHANENPAHFLLFLIPLVTAGITAFYMFRMWFLTFLGTPGDRAVVDHAHENPPVMTGPLIVLSALAAFCAVGGEGGWLYKLLIHSAPEYLGGGTAAFGHIAISLPGLDAVHAVHSQAGVLALTVAFLGTVVAYLLYGLRWVDPADIQKQFRTLHRYLADRWRFDELYDAVFVQPARIIGRWVVLFDRHVLDAILHGLAATARTVATWDRRFDETVVDGLVNRLADGTRTVGSSLRSIQTGRLRQYVMFIAVGVMGLFLLLFTFFPKA